MIKKEIILQGRNLDKLISEAETELSSSRDSIEIEIIEENKTLLGVNYKIKAFLKTESKMKKIEKIIDDIQDNWESKISDIITEEKVLIKNIEYKVKSLDLIMNRCSKGSNRLRLRNINIPRWHGSVSNSYSTYRRKRNKFG